MTNTDLYKNTIKSNSLFGGIKVFQIIVVLIRTKILALILGPGGLGFQSLLMSSIDSLQQFTTFGIFQSSVRDISNSNINDTGKREKIIGVFKFLILATGLFGMIICAVFSGLLSDSVFGNKNHQGTFIIVSFSLIFLSLSNGYVAIFQGLRKLPQLAKGSLFGAFISIIVVTPLYSVWGIKAVPYAIVINSFLVFFIYWLYSRKIHEIIVFPITKYKEILEYGKPILKLGAILMLSNGIMTIFTLGLNTFINRYGGITQVGYFNAAFTCTYGNIIIITSILSSDYYPRLSASLHDFDNFRTIVNHQIELIILIVGPIICLIIPFAYYVVIILFSKDFITIVPMIQIMSISLIFKVVWHALSYIILAQGDRKTYLIYDAIIGNGLVFSFNIAGFFLHGLLGLGISFILGSVLMVFLLYFVISKKYNIYLKKGFWKLFILMITVISVSYFSSILLINSTTILLIQITVFLLISYISFYILNKRIELIKSLRFFKK